MSIRDASRSIKFVFLDGSIAIPLVLTLLSPSKFTFGCLFVVSIILFLLGRRGMNLQMLSRKVRSVIIGKTRNIRPPWREN